MLTVDLFEDFESQSFGFEPLPQDLWLDSAAQLMLSIAQLRCVIRELFAGLLMSWIRGTPGLSDSLSTEYQNFAVGLL